MATTKKAKAHSSEVRVGEVTLADLQSQIAKIESLTEQLRGRSVAMQNADLRGVTIDGVTKLRRGIELVAEFDAKLALAIFKAS